MDRIITQLLDWRMQFQDYKALILTGDTPKERLRVIRQFVPKNFEDMMHVNLKNNQKVREYINNNPPGPEAYFYLEKTLMGMIVPGDTCVVFENADACDHKAVFDYAENLFAEEDMGFLILTGDFTEEELEAYGDRFIHIDLPPAEKDADQNK